MPDLNSNGLSVGLFPIADYVTASYQINSGSVAANTTVTDSVTVTGVLTTDNNIGICARDAVVIPVGLQFVSIVVTAANTVAVTWRNVTASAITTPAAAVWTVDVFGIFHR